MKTNYHSEISKSLQRLITNGKTPGLQYVVLKEHSVLYEQNMGMADFEMNKAIDHNSLFNACSVTKTFTSLAIMQLAEAEKIKLTDSVSIYLDDYPFSEDIKIHQLLSHTSGISNPIPLRWAHLQEEEASFNSGAFIKEVLNKYSKLKTSPGEKFAYSNLNYLILGKIIEKAAGVQYVDYIRQHIISKLGLNGSPMDFVLTDDQDYSRGYQKRVSFLNLMLGLFLDRKKFIIASQNRSWIKFKKYYVNGSAYGGIITNASSLAKFAEELFKPESTLLSGDWKNKLFTKQRTNNGTEIEMTLGWFTGSLNGDDYFAHAGAGGGYYCEMRIYPGKNIISVITFNRTGIRDERFLDTLDCQLISQ